MARRNVTNVSRGDERPALSSVGPRSEAAKFSYIDEIRTTVSRLKHHLPSDLFDNCIFKALSPSVTGADVQRSSISARMGLTFRNRTSSFSAIRGPCLWASSDGRYDRSSKEAAVSIWLSSCSASSMDRRKARSTLRGDEKSFANPIGAA